MTRCVVEVTNRNNNKNNRRTTEPPLVQHHRPPNHRLQHYPPSGSAVRMLLEVVLLGITVYILLYRHSKVPKGMPPGSLGLPLIGCPPLGHSRKREHFLALKKKYGDIFTRQWCSRRVVILADAALIRRARCNLHLQSKPTIFSFNINSNFLELGVVASHGQTWATNRKFMIRHVDVIASSRVKQEMVISREVALWIQHLEGLPLDKPVYLDWSLNVAILNVLFQMLANLHYEMDDEEMQTISRILNDNIAIGGGPMALLDVFPGLHKYLPNVVLNKLMKVDVVERNRDVIFAVFAKLVEEHRWTLDRANPRDLIDHYLLEAEEVEEGDAETPFADDRNLLVMIHDVFVAGSETSSSTLRWLVLYLALNQQIQSKIHESIDAAVPKDRRPTLEDRNHLVYLDATILDTMRLSSLFPVAVHTASEATTLQGYTIPKNTMVVSSLETCHRDPAVWERPDHLHPQHFLDSDDKLVSRRDSFLPFSAGKRSCPGEPLARVELFLFAAALLQRFSITAPPGDTLESYLTPEFGVLNLPRKFGVCLTKRTTNQPTEIN